METAKSKAKRHIAGAYILVILVFVIPAIVGSTGYTLQSMASSQLPSGNTAVTQANTWAVYTLQGKSIPASGTTFNLPVNTTSAVIITALTVGEAQNYTITKLVLNPSVNVNENIQVYFAIGTSATNYTIMYQINTALTVKNGTTSANPQISIPITPDYYSFPATNHWIIIIQNLAIGSEFSGLIALYGSTNSAINILLSPQGTIDISLVLVGIFAVVLGTISIPWVEMHLDKPYRYIRTKINTRRARPKKESKPKKSHIKRRR